MVKALLEKHQIPAVVIEPATVFLRAGKQTADSVVSGVLLRAALTRGRAVVVVFERCDELVPMDSRDECLVWLVAQWAGRQRQAAGDSHDQWHGNVRYVATTARPLDHLHGLWRAAFADACHLTIQPELFSPTERHLLLSNVFLTTTSPELVGEAVRCTGGFLPCDLHLLARQLSHCSSPSGLAAAAAEIRDEMLTMGRIRRQEIEYVAWDDVYGQDLAKGELVRLAQLLTDPAHRRLYNERGLEWPRGVVLYGPPGTGKTRLARAMAHSGQAHFMALSLSELVHAEVGASEAALREVFATARRLQPTIVFLDELDALVAEPHQDHVQSVSARLMLQLCEELDELGRRGAEPTGPGEPEDLVLVLGATNLLDALPAALLQYGRLGRQIHVGPLTVQEQARMLSRELSKIDMDVGADAILPHLTGPDRTGAQVVQLLDRFKGDLFTANVHQDPVNLFAAFIKDAG